MTYKLDEFLVVETSIAVCVSPGNDQLLFVLRQYLVVDITQFDAAIQHLRQRDAAFSLKLSHTRTHHIP